MPETLNYLHGDCIKGQKPMKNFYNEIKRASETIPYFFFVSLLFFVFLQYGSDKLKTQAASAIFGMINASALALLFLTFTTVTGATLLICGTLTSESSDLKAKAIRLFVERPAALENNRGQTTESGK